MTILYYVVSEGEKENDDFFVYLRTLDGKKAEKLHNLLTEHYPDIKILTFELDEPVYDLDIQFKDGFVGFNMIEVGEPSEDPDLADVTIKRKKRLV